MKKADTLSLSRLPITDMRIRGGYLPTPYIDESVGNTYLTKLIFSHFLDATSLNHQSQSLHLTTSMYRPPPDQCPGTCLIRQNLDPRRCKDTSDGSSLATWYWPSQIRSWLGFPSTGTRSSTLDVWRGRSWVQNRDVWFTIFVGFCKSPRFAPRTCAPLQCSSRSHTFCIWFLL